jgi:hypothetical protein
MTEQKDNAGPSGASAGYAALLRDPRWQRRRLHILQRDDFCCTACGNGESTLHVHHKRYSGKPWEAADDDLQTLCEQCHAAIGPHPKGGVFYEWWILDDDNKMLSIAYEHCPLCGDAKDASHSGIVAFSCGHSFYLSELHGTGIETQWQGTHRDAECGPPAFVMA